MSWQDLLQSAEDTIVLPWCGESKITDGRRYWKVSRRPPEFGWYEFTIAGRNVSYKNPANLDDSIFVETKSGYLIGDRLIKDDVVAFSNPKDIRGESVFLIESGLDKFSRVKVGRVNESSPWIFLCIDFGFGCEPEVLSAYLDRQSIKDIKGVPSSLAAVFNIENWLRDEADRLQREIEAREAAERAREAALRAMGTSAGRRDLARYDFRQAATSALAVSGAEYIDHRMDHYNNYIVRYRLRNRRFESVVTQNLSVLEAGICLTDEETGDKGDTFFTLESLPFVIMEAIDTGVLVVFRHA
jgi:hypothetical protein